MLVSCAGGLLVMVATATLRVRLPRAIPENACIGVCGLNRMPSLYGATAVLLLAITLVMGLFHYIASMKAGTERWSLSLDSAIAADRRVL